MAKAKTTLAGEDFKALYNLIKGLSDEATFVFSEDGVTVTVLDHAKVAMYRFELSGMEGYEAPEEPIDVTLQIKDLRKVATAAKKGVVIDFGAGEGEAVFTLYGKGPKKKYTVRAMEVETAQYPEPKVSFTAMVTVPAADLAEAIDALASHKAELILEDGVLKVRDAETAGTLFSEVEIEAVEWDGKAKASYSVDYLKLLKNAKGAGADHVTIEFGDDIPMKATFISATGARHTIFIAPVVE